MSFFLTLTLFGAALWFWLSVLLFVIICFISDVKEEGYGATVALIAFSILLYFWGDLKPITSIFTIQNGLIYLGIGLVFSTIRTFFSARQLWETIKNLPVTTERNSKYDTQEYKKEKFINELKGNVFRWWFMWPISMITWLVTDIVRDIWNYLYSKFKGFFEFIVELGIKSAK
jgi:hypothetical protein